MAFKLDFTCAYVDYRSVSKVKLAQHFNERTTGLRVGHESVLLKTCHRIEEYTFGKNAYTREHFGPLEFNIQSITGDGNVLNRLARIVSGVDSWILGEQYIALQVRNAFQKVASNSRLSLLGEKALEIGLRAKEATGLVTLTDYPDIALYLIDKALKGKTEDLLVIGGGMLGRSVSEKAIENGWSNTLIVSRNPKKTRKMGHKNALNLSQAENLIGEVSAVIVATTDITAAYKLEIESFIQRSNCKTVIDLSSYPQIKRSENYIHMYDSIFANEIVNANKVLQSKVPATVSMISDMVEQQMRNGL